MMYLNLLGEQRTFTRQKRDQLSGVGPRDAMLLYNDGNHLYFLKQGGGWEILPFRLFALGCGVGGISNFAEKEAVIFQHCGHNPRKSCNILLRIPSGSWVVHLELRRGYVYRIVDSATQVAIFHRPAEMKYVVVG